MTGAYYDARWRLGAAAAGVALVLAVGASPAAAQEAPPKPDTSKSEARVISVNATPLAGFDKLNASRLKFGRLQWIGGLVLSAQDRRFGGWSGLALDGSGRRLVAVSDAGTWMTADLVYDGKKPKGLANARLGPLKARDGGPLRRDRDRDAEALVLTRGSIERGSLLIAFEQNHRIGQFDISHEGVSSPSSYLPVPAEAKRMRALKGFESLAEVRSGRHRGALVALAEHLLDPAGHHSGWIMRRGKSERFSYLDIGGFDPTDAVGLDNGDIIVLERRFRWMEGVKMRIRRIASAELQPGAVIKGEVLLEADMSEEIDNMEAISAHRAADGGTVLTVMSDDNFNGFLQRTLLLQFHLAAPAQAQRASR